MTTPQNPFGAIRVVNKKEKDFSIASSKLDNTRSKIVTMLHDLLSDNT